MHEPVVAPRDTHLASADQRAGSEMPNQHPPALGQGASGIAERRALLGVPSTGEQEQERP
eukprot:9098237-Pyramimonas_sp.AAC.1